MPPQGVLSRYLDQPELPFDLATYGTLITERASTPYARALAIESAVRSGRQLSSKSISGSAHWRLQAFLLGERSDPGARIGTSEQFATAFAVLVRNSGLPTRVVVGFRPGTEDPAGTRVIRGSDALAWPEVYFAGLGWVPFSPTPDDDTFAADRPQPGEAPRGPAVVVPPPSPGPGDESAVQLGERLRTDYGVSAGSRLAELAERAAFGPGPAPATGGPSRHDVREVRRAVRRRLSWWRRIWWPFDHRVPLRRRLTP